MPKRIVIRADGGKEIGGGHIMRCLTLSEAIKRININAEIYFICSEDVKGFDYLFNTSSINLNYIPSKNSVYHSEFNWLNDAQSTENILKIIGKVDWVIVDHYKLDAKWERYIKNHIENILVIDDLANREHYCNIILDQTYGISHERYRSLVPRDCVVLTGTNYALLRKCFSPNRKDILEFRNKESKEKKVLVSLGASDPLNYTEFIVDTILTSKIKTTVDIVLGPINLNKENLKVKYSHLENVRVFESIEPEIMSELMLNSYVAIGAGGTSSWERCSCGLPTIILVMADNQREIAKQLAFSGAVKVSDVNTLAEDFDNLLSAWEYDPLKYIKSVEACLSVCDGYGTIRVAKRVIEYGKN